MIAQRQGELNFGELDAGSYEIGGERATWRRKGDKIIELKFRRRTFDVATEGRGIAGNPRFYIVGHTKKDGKLLQARSLVTLVKQLADESNIVSRKVDEVKSTVDEMAVDVRDIKAAVAQMLGDAPRKRPTEERSKIGPSRAKRRSNVTPSDVLPSGWHQKKYIPLNAPGIFSRVPEILIPPSTHLSAGAFRLYLAYLSLAMTTGLITAGKHLLALKAGMDEANVKKARAELIEWKLVRPTGRKLSKSRVELELLTHPWICAAESLEWGEGDAKGGNSEDNGGKKFPPKGVKWTPNKTNQENKIKDESEIRARSSRKDSPRSAAVSDREKRDAGQFAVPRENFPDEYGKKLFDLLGTEEMRSSGIRWIGRCNLERDAIITILSDFEATKEPIKNVPAWFEAAWQKDPAGRREKNSRERARRRQ